MNHPHDEPDLEGPSVTAGGEPKDADDTDNRTTANSTDESGDPALLPQKETILSGDSDTEEEVEQAKKEATEEGSPFWRYVVIYGAAFFLITAIVLVPLALLTDFFENDSSSTATPLANVGIPFPGAPTGLPFPAPVTLPPIPAGQTYAPSSLPPTMAPSKGAQTTLAPSIIDSIDPTPRRTGAEETVLPTMIPTTSPESAPSMSPSDPPSLAPTTGPPTEEPSAAPIDLTKTPLFNYLVVLGTPEEVLSDPTTPQGKAYLWLMQPDIEPIGVFRVPQRFALVALDFALHEQEVKVVSAWQAFVDRVQERSYTPWRQKDKDICDWEGVSCDLHEEVIGIKWSNQDLRGSIIPEIALLPKLQKVDLAENRITGTLEPFWELPELTHLYLFSNRLSGTIPGDRPAPSKLIAVYLGHNDLTGTLPLTLASSQGPRDLRYLILHHNNLSGMLPEGMRLRNLYYLDLSNNDFEGPVPSDWLFYLQTLRVLYLSNNRLSGELTKEFSLLGNGRLKQLFIENNNFSGSFPSDSWNDYHMTNMNIAQNNFDDADICKLSVFEEGEMVEFRADCDICWCDDLCHTCHGGDQEVERQGGKKL